jgi:hypothetical protein
MRKNRARKQRFADLAGDVGNPRVVEQIDEALREMIHDWLDLQALRARATERHNINTPAPSMPTTINPPAVYVKNARQAPPTKPVTDGLNLVAGSAADACWRIIEPRAMGVTHAEMREEFGKTPAGQSARGDRGYHQALQRLKSTGHVVVSKSRLWAHHRLEAFKRDVAAGRVKDIEEQPRFHGRWHAAVLSFLREHGDWVSASNIAAHVSKQPGFEDQKNTFTMVCTALRGLNYRHKLVERKGQGKGAVWRAIPKDGTVEAGAVKLDLELEGLERPEVRH